MSTKWNQQLTSYVFSKVIECLGKKTFKQIDCKGPSSTKQMNKYKIFELKYANRNKTKQV